MENSEDVIVGCVLIVWFVAVHVGMAGVLRKTGRPAWFAMIPGLNMYEVCRAAGVSGLWVSAIFIPLGNFAAGMYVAIKLSERFGASDWFGIALGCTGFGLLPALAFRRTQPRDLAGQEVTYLQEDADYLKVDQWASAHHDDQHRSAKVGMIVLTMVYCLSLLCTPGLMVVGVMAFDGVSQVTLAMEVVIGLTLLFPLSVLCALGGGWLFYWKRHYGWAFGLAGLPVVNVVMAFAVFVVAFG